MTASTGLWSLRTRSLAPTYVMLPIVLLHQIVRLMVMAVSYGRPLNNSSRFVGKQ